MGFHNPLFHTHSTDQKIILRAALWHPQTRELTERNTCPEHRTAMPITDGSCDQVHLEGNMSPLHLH